MFVLYFFKNADEITRELFRDPEIFADCKKGVKLKDNPRLTKTGAILRKTSIDELPQLLNVLTILMKTPLAVISHKGAY